MARNKNRYLIQVIYKNNKYEFSFFYEDSRDKLKLKDNRLVLKDGDIEFIDGCENVEINIYNDYKVDFLETTDRSHIVKIKANRYEFIAFRPLHVYKEREGSYRYYYKKKLIE